GNRKVSQMGAAAAGDRGVARRRNDLQRAGTGGALGRVAELSQACSGGNRQARRRGAVCKRSPGPGRRRGARERRFGSPPESGRKRSADRDQASHSGRGRAETGATVPLFQPYLPCPTRISFE